MVAAFQKRKELVYDLMKDIPGIKMNQPKGAFYFFPDVSSYFGKSYNGEVIKDATDLCMFLLNKGLVALVSGDAFGNPECLRISYATSEEVLKESINRIKNTLTLLK